MCYCSIIINFYLMFFTRSLMALLELLSDHEVELASAVSVIVVETVTPVNSEETDHRQEDSHTDTGRSSDLERIEVADI